MSNDSYGQVALTVLGTEIELDRPISRARFERPFTVVVGVEELRHDVVGNLSERQLGRAVHALLAYTDERPVAGRVVQAFVYMTGADSSAQDASLDSTRGFSLLVATEAGLEHAFYERVGDRFARVAALSGPLDGSFDSDDVRLLHFAALGERPLPARSTILQLNSGPWAQGNYPVDRNTRLRWAVLADPARSAGARTLGLYSTTLFRDIAGDDTEKCGSDDGCPTGKKSCGYGPAGPDKVCNVPEPQGDIFVDIERALAVEDGGSSRPPIDYVLARQALDRLETSREGRQLISGWYRLGLFFRVDTDAFAVIEEARPGVEAFLRRIVAGSDDDILVDDDLAASVKAVVQGHRTIPDENLQQLLDAVERSLPGWVGRARAELLGAKA
jgi:hypothetical protein